MNIALNLRLEDVQLQWKKFVTLQNKLNIPFPILNKAQLRYRVQQPPSKHSSGTSMKGGDCLQKKLQKESRKTMELKRILCQLQEQQWTSHPQNNTEQRRNVIGRRRSGDHLPAPQTQTQAIQAPTANPQTNVTKYRITKCTTTVNLFDPPAVKNRRMTPSEKEF